LKKNCTTKRSKVLDAFRVRPDKLPMISKKLNSVKIEIGTFVDIASVIIKLQFFKILLKIDTGSTSNLNSKVQLKSLLRKNFKEITTCILIIEDGRRSIGPGNRFMSSLSLVEYYCMQMGIV
jgi:hypothetical protein